MQIMRYKFFKLLVVLIAPVAVVVFGYVLTKKQNPVPAAGGKISIMVSLLPQKEFVEKVGGDKISVNVMIGLGFNEATYEPSPSQLLALQQTALYVRIGYIPFEYAYIPKIQAQNPNIKVVNAARGVPVRRFSAEEKEREEKKEHSSAAEADRTAPTANQAVESDVPESTIDPHLWLSPPLVKIQVENIYEALVELDPTNTTYYRQNANQYLIELDALHQTLQNIFANLPAQNKKLLVFHPTFGYFADTYGLEQIPIEVAGKEPTAQQLAALIERAKQENIKVVFVQKQFSTKNAQMIADALGGVTVTIDPLAPDYLENMQQMAEVMNNYLRSTSAAE